MARRPKRRTQATRQRRPAVPAASAGAGSGAAATAPRPEPQTLRLGGDQATIRAVERSIAPGAARRGGRLVLDSADPAIPLDRVPYFIPDLKRLGVVAGIMVVLLVLGAEFIIPLIVK